ncbi:MAG: leucine-rich repeat domain-containing protein [Candidatus Lokiarchaeota archaeon]|nr:leucine-rich repeat domain-containing protein [Candidatus Lokiarchaeota archaeon]
MARGSVAILDDDAESDVAAFMLEACGIDTIDFYGNERVLTRKNFEKNYNVLEKMVQVRQIEDPQFIYGINESSRAPYFVIGYFALLTGARISERLRRGILEAAKWECEDGYWEDDGFALKRRIYLDDFREKISLHKAGQKLHTALFKYSERDFMESKVVVGINQFRDYCDYGKIQGVKHVNLDGWGLQAIPSEVFELNNLKSLSLEFNELKELPKEILNLTALKHLYIDYNLLETLPESIGMLSSLRSLSIIHNNVSYLPESLRNLKNLKYIYVRGTKISRAPAFLKTAEYDELTKTIYLHNEKKKLK